MLYHPRTRDNITNWGRAREMVAKGSEQKHILVVNDTVAILELFTVLLEDEGYRVSTDGFSVELAEMLARIREMQPDLIVLDLVIMEEGKGWQMLQLLRMDRETRHIPVIICTAASRLVDDLQTHLDTMKVSVVLKPFDIDHLLAVITKSLGEKRSD
jgi:CheY-like chemotaxis protein